MGITTTVEMRFADGSVIDAWESFSLRESFTDPLGNFSFVARPPREHIADYRKRLRKGELVTIHVGEANQGSYLIQERELVVDRQGGVTISVCCQTVLVTPYQGSVDPKLSLRAQTDVPVVDAILRAMAPYGFTIVIGDSAATANAVSGKPLDGRKAAITVDALKHQEAQAQDGETAYEFCKRIVTRFGCILRVAFDGTLLVTAPDYDQAPAYTIVQSFDGPAPEGDVALSVRVLDSNDGQCSECVVRGVASFVEGSKQANEPRALVAPASPLPFYADAAAVNAAKSTIEVSRKSTSSAKLAVSTYETNRPLYSSTAAAYKPKIVKDKNSRDNARALSTAKLALTKGAMQAYAATVDVDGFISTTGRVWAIDTTARVYIEAEGLDETMWLMSRELRQSRDGQSATLTFITNGALVLGDIPG